MNKLKALRCFETTSERQVKNGTIRYHDPIAKCDYMSYSNGYVRRSYKWQVNPEWPPMQHMYQVNPQRRVKMSCTFSDGRVFNYVETKRIMIHDPEEREEILARAVVNYREYIKKNNVNTDYHISVANR